MDYLDDDYIDPIALHAMNIPSMQATDPPQEVTSHQSQNTNLSSPSTTRKRGIDQETGSTEQSPKKDSRPSFSFASHLQDTSDETSRIFTRQTTPSFMVTEEEERRDVEQTSTTQEIDADSTMKEGETTSDLAPITSLDTVSAQQIENYENDFPSLLRFLNIPIPLATTFDPSTFLSNPTQSFTFPLDSRANQDTNGQDLVDIAVDQEETISAAEDRMITLALSTSTREVLFESMNTTAKHPEFFDVFRDANGDISITISEEAKDEPLYYTSYESTPRETRFTYQWAKDLDRFRLLFFLDPLPVKRNDRKAEYSMQSLQIRATLFSQAITTKTWNGYAGYALEYLKWNDEKGDDRLPSHKLFPCTHDLFMKFIAEHYSTSLRPKTLCSIASAFSKWHTIHSLEFILRPKEWKTYMRGMKTVGNKAKKERRPVCLEDLRKFSEYVIKLHEKQPEMFPLSTVKCLRAVSSVAFFGIARLQDLTSENQTKFDPNSQTSTSDPKFYEESGEFPPMVEIPVNFDKANGNEGAILVIIPQTEDPDIDPIKCLFEHLIENKTKDRPNQFLFSYRSRDGTRYINMTKNFFLSTFNAAMSEYGREDVDGHGFRVGGNSFYAIGGVAMEEIRHAGRWRGAKVQAGYTRWQSLRAAKELRKAKDTGLDFGNSADINSKIQESIDHSEDDEEEEEPLTHQNAPSPKNTRRNSTTSIPPRSPSSSTSSPTTTSSRRHSSSSHSYNLR